MTIERNRGMVMVMVAIKSAAWTLGDILARLLPGSALSRGCDVFGLSPNIIAENHNYCYKVDLHSHELWGGLVAAVI